MNCVDHTAGEVYLLAGNVGDSELDSLECLVHFKTRIVAVVVGQRHKVIALLAVVTEKRTGIALCVRAVAVTVEISAEGRKLVKILGERVDEELGNLLLVLLKDEEIFLLAVEGVVEFKNTVGGSDRYGMLGRGGEVAYLVVICADDVDEIFRAVKEEECALVGNDLDLGLLVLLYDCGYYAVIGYGWKHFCYTP